MRRPAWLTFALALGAAGAVAAAEPAPVLAPLGRTTTVQLALPAGAPVERAVPGRAFAQAVVLDAEQRWADAAALYQQAVNEWAVAQRLRPSPALARAVQKAERERQRSLLLAGLQPLRGRPPMSLMNPLEEGRLYRAKLMVVRAARGAVPAGLFARARNAFEAALRGPAAQRSGGGEAEIQLLLCGTHAATGDATAARLARARVSEAERHDLDNLLAMAVCEAALGEHETALAHLEMFVLRPPPHQPDPAQLRDLYVANDWDRLRGQPRFESLFR